MFKKIIEPTPFGAVGIVWASVEGGPRIVRVLLSRAGLAALYPDEIEVFDDYIGYSSRLRPVLKSHVQKILKSGVSVVLDFPANTVNQRKWFKEILSNEEIPHKLIYIDASDRLCLSQIQSRRNDQPERAQFDTEKVFKQVTSYFQPPTEKEGFNIEVVIRKD